ncbi:MAG TPA: cupin domain-containing protein [Bryobacteraceae bacterium]|nr:cupin domain-containing protein [Bryobacteraceae bacterium]
MRTISIVITATAFAASALAQPSAPSMKEFASSADVQAMIAKAKRERKEGQPLVAQRILQLAPYNVNLEYRASVGPASIHEKEAELFYVIEGSATMVTGGKLTEEKRTNPENLSGAGIEGGESRPIAKGDFIIVPENTAHWFSKIDGVLVLMSLHVPRPVPH